MEPQSGQEEQPELTLEVDTKAWLHAQRSKYGVCALDLPFKPAAAASSSKQARADGSSISSVVASLPATVKEALQAGDPAEICLTGLHVLMQRYAGPCNGMYAVRGSDGPASICFVGASSDDSTSLATARAECKASLQVARPHAVNCATLAESMNGDMPRPVVHLRVCNHTPPAVKAEPEHRGILMDVSIQAATITVTWDDVAFDSVYLEKTAAHMLPLMVALCGESKGPALGTDYLTAGERQLLHDCNKTDALVPPGCIHNFLTAAAAESPSRPCVICGSQTWSYAEMDSWSSNLAALLQSQHAIGPGTRVGIYLERRIELVGSLLAVLKAGATYVPLDPLYPRDRIGMMVEDGQVSVILTSNDLINVAAEIVAGTNIDCTVVSIDCQETKAAAQTQRHPPQAWTTDEKSIAYIIFTSGSTGRPKGVPIRHSSLINFLHSFVEHTRLSQSDVLLAVTTVCFDIAGLELYLPLMRGAAIVLASAEQQSDPNALEGLMQQYHVTILQATPVTWRLLIGNGWTGSTNLTALCGGEPLPADLATTLRPLVQRLVNVYGPTETTIWSTLQEIELSEDGTVHAPVSIGLPIKNTTVYVVDQKLRLCAPGVPGELLIGGAGVSPGYWMRNDLSQGRFVPSPFVNGDVLYCTGDLVRWTLPKDEKPTLECLGRIDNQVKIRGFRIELAEIETALSTSPLVEQVVVDAMAIAEESETKELVAYVKSPRSAEVTETDAGTPVEDMGQKDLDEAEAWGAVYDEAYATKRAATDDPTLNWSGYDNSYTPGILHKEPVVKEWVERTCERLNRFPYSRVLELGCGNGMILFRILKERPLQRYIGTDFSTEAIKYVEDVLNHNPEYGKYRQITSTAQAGAHESGRFAEEKLDMIICNGVSMYFPSAAYLLQTINESLKALEPGGIFFLGDVRCLNLHEHFIASVELFKSPEDTAAEDFVTTCDKAKRQEKELLVDPEFFIAVLNSGLIKNCARMEMDMKQGYLGSDVNEANPVWNQHVGSEFSMYRYDVTFWKPAAGETLEKPAKYKVDSYDATTHSDFEKVMNQRLMSGTENYVAISGVPDKRLCFEECLIQTIKARTFGPLPATTGELARQVKTQSDSTTNVAPDICYRIAERHGYRATLMWTPAGASNTITFDVLFQKVGSPMCVNITEAVRNSDLSAAVQYTVTHAEDMDVEIFTNKTEEDGENTELTAQDISILRAQLRGTLPEYMIPSVFVPVDDFPMTNNGKIDRKSLPRPEKIHLRQSLRSAEYVEPQDGVESKVAAIWREAFGLADISAIDDFHALGGHSLIAMKMLNLLKKGLGVSMTMADLAKYATPREITAFLATATDGIGPAAPESAGLPVHCASSYHVATDLPFKIKTIPHIWIPMRDKIRLGARIWLPEGIERAPVIIEIQPYRKSGGTSDVDEATFPFFAGNGFVCIRVDSRGTGDSEGEFDDEYSHLQQQDGLDVVNWAAAQLWSDGTCGLMGCSWGGFVAMQVAAIAPADSPLKSIMAVCATDKRLEDDMHFAGPGVLLSENHSWGSWLLHTLSLPPDPNAVGHGSWREIWLQRLASLMPLTAKWLQRSGNDAKEKYWETGSSGGNIPPISIPTFLCGGWSAGSYSNSVFRVAEQLNAAGVAHKAVVGPWAHSYPHLSAIGPHYNFLGDALKWWTTHLGSPSSQPSASGACPRFQVFSVCPSSQAPASQTATVPGTWMDYDALRQNESELVLALDAERKLVEVEMADAVYRQLPIGLTGDERRVRIPAGSDTLVTAAARSAGRWFTFGTSPDRPINQAEFDAESACFEFTAREAIILHGQPAVNLVVSSPGACTSKLGTLCARLCAVSPSGVSTRITYGLLNVDRHCAAMPVIDGGCITVPVALKMDHTVFTVPESYTLRLAISHGCWPIVAVPETALPPQIVVDGASTLSLPITTVATAGTSSTVLTTIDQDVYVTTPTPITNLRRANDAVWSATCGDAEVEVKSLDDRGCRRLGGPENGLEIDSTVSESRLAKRAADAGFDNSKIQMATHNIEWHTTQFRPATDGGNDIGWLCDVRLRSEQKISRDGTVELLTKLSAFEARAKNGGEVDATLPLQPVVTREWRDRIHSL